MSSLQGQISEQVSNIIEKFNIKKTAKIHFIGICGIGMSGIAKILKSLGFDVQGSDTKNNGICDSLSKMGIPIFPEHSAQNISNVDLIVKSSAISQDNPELKEALRSGKKIISRGEMLAAIVNDCHSICIAGAHGKTTTTAMIAKIFLDLTIEPMVIAGGILRENNTNAIIRNLPQKKEKTWCVVESDESDGSFLLLKPELAIITNIDKEHLDHYETFYNLKKSFVHFIQNVHAHGGVIANLQDKNVFEILLKVKGTIPQLSTYELCLSRQDHDLSVERAFAVGSTTHIIGTNVRFLSDFMIYDCDIYNITSNGSVETINYSNLHLRAHGTYNVQNSLAALGVALFYKFDVNRVFTSLSHFCGVERRFTKIGKFNGADVVDDYAHHPHEILNVISSTKALLQNNTNGGKVIAIIQPHRYTRLAALMDEFVRAISLADCIIILEVYSASEKPISGIDSEVLYYKIKKCHNRVYYAHNNNIQNIKEELNSYVTNDDVILCMGAGDITKIASDLLKNN